MNPFDVLLLLLLIVPVPLYSAWSYRSLQRSVERGHAGARVRFYRQTVLEEWLFAAVVMVAWLAAGRTLRDLGLTPGFVPESGWTGPVVAALGLAAVAALVVQWRMAGSNPASLEQLRTQLQPLRALLPHDDREGAWFAAVSVTAGVCEEIVYRGFLLGVLAAATGSGLLALVLSTLVFALAHVYLGRSGAVRAGIAGLVMGFVFLATGSLVVPILLHAVLDATSGSLARRAFAVPA